MVRSALQAAQPASTPRGMASGAGRGEKMMSRRAAARAQAPGVGSTSSLRRVATSA